jgi:hypothetical protein
MSGTGQSGSSSQRPFGLIPGRPLVTPSLALGQTALAVYDKAFGTNMRASWPLPPASLPTQWTRLAGAEL